LAVDGEDPSVPSARTVHRCTVDGVVRRHDVAVAVLVKVFVVPERARDELLAVVSVRDGADGVGGGGTEVLPVQDDVLTAVRDGAVVQVHRAVLDAGPLRLVRHERRGGVADVRQVPASEGV
jgi:hypothetical protein